ncbi:MAG: sugar-transfer associated ATP-grasp domain-containing protein [Candidatus Microbacterium phytovorans]|uniref:Sugar-transfer associated ATP-grasp domain-containing protein n=1 Tax=Candidatus Microbacterium phytovorans TaxID=3121374 RepID=A0AAJ5W1Z2_9MICO|nr:sugar-transfer associated ATP-grasp domain-containing protein [Microbacterium sp.]WEK14379.1 MAG: sugar-transfer associated ATP-grasp domain-containing protein [Microbacterium sp.]
MGKATVRLRYLARRARKLRPGNLIEFARQAQKVSRAPLPVLIADMLWCSLKYDMGFRDYAVWDIRLLTAKERATWMTHPKSFRITRMHNTPEGRAKLEDKRRFAREYADLLGRETIDLRDVDDAELGSFLSRHPKVLAKPFEGQGGGGITLYENVTDAAAFRAEITAAGQSIVDEFIVQHPQMSALYPDSVNTVRMITFLDTRGGEPGRVHLLAAVLRIGNGDVIDNFASGGMFTMLDEQGVALYPGVDKKSNVYAEHPVTGTPIVGFAVPMYDEIVALTEKLARRTPEAPYVGWDLAITPDGPVVIEGNHNSSVFQPKPSASGVRTGLLPVYQAAVGF